MTWDQTERWIRRPLALVFFVAVAAMGLFIATSLVLGF